MDLSKLSQNDRITLGAAAVVAVTALLSISNAWGALMFLSLAAGVGAIAVILQPMLAPTVKLPVTKAQALVGLGGVATVATGLTALNWLEWIIEYFGDVRHDPVRGRLRGGDRALRHQLPGLQGRACGNRRTGHAGRAC